MASPSSESVEQYKVRQASLIVLSKRHGISRPPEVTGDKEPKKKFKTYPTGYFHTDIAEVRTAEGKLHLYLGIYRYPLSSPSSSLSLWRTG